MTPAVKMPYTLMRRLGCGLMLPAAILSAIATPSQLQTATAQTSGDNRPLTINSDIQEYDAKTQVATARGNVQMVYPARDIQATAVQAQYFSQERKIVLSGNVYILQKGGNSMRGEVVTYLIDEGRFIAQPRSGRQVESTYIVRDTAVSNATPGNAPATAPLRR